MSNPLLRQDVFIRNSTNGAVMTVGGVINKSIILWFFLGASAVYSWMNPAISGALFLPAVFIGFLLALIVIFKKAAAPFLSPVYAVMEGMFLGYISLLFEKSYPGIVINAILLTIAVLFCMLAAYKSRLLVATPMFKKVVIISTFAIVIVYIVDILLGFTTGSRVPLIHETSWIGILASLFIVVIASLNLIIDFDIIEKGARKGAPKYMEWYGAFILMITLVWLYLELLRLLSKLKD
jgi:Predicted membrane protein